MTEWFRWLALVMLVPGVAGAQSSSPVQSAMKDCLGKASTDEQLQCFGIVVQKLDECKTKTERTDQVACFAQQAGITPPAKSETASGSAWKLQTSVDKLDGTTTVIIALDSSDRLKATYGRDEEGTLIIRCLKNTTEAFVTWPEYLGSRSVEVKWRADGQPISTEWWSPSSSGKAVFAPNSVTFVKKLFSKNEFLINVQPYGKVAATLTFPVAGLEEAIKPLRAACKW